jgi:hypothetical protein
MSTGLLSYQRVNHEPTKSAMVGAAIVATIVQLIVIEKYPSAPV